MYVLQGIAVMLFIALVPSAGLLLFDRYCERNYRRHEAMRRHPCNYRPTYPISNVKIVTPRYAKEEIA